MIPVEKFYRERGNDYSTEDGLGGINLVKTFSENLGLSMVRKTLHCMMQIII